MSLQAWYPLDGDLKNYGIGQLTPTVSTTPTYINEGKISTKAMSTGGFKWTAAQTEAVLNNQAVSFAFWIKPINSSAGQIFGTDNMGANNNRKFAIYAYPTGNDLHLSWMNDAASTTFAGGVWSNVFPINIWTHCCITYNNPIISIYINGVLKSTTSGISASSSFAYETQIIHNSTNRYLNDFRIYNHCLNPKEVRLLAQGLVAHYKMDGFNPNLIMGGKGDRYGTGYRVATYSFDRIGFQRYLTEGEKCSLSICFTPSNDFGYWFPHLNEGAWGGWMPPIYSDGTTNRQIVTAISLDGWKYHNGSISGINPESDPSRTNICMYVKNNSGGNGTSGTTIHWISLQAGDKPAFCWLPSISENNMLYNQELDSSGYNNNCNKVGKVIITGDSPRYSFSTNFNNQGYAKNDNFNITTSQFTVSFWLKVPSVTNAQHFLFGTHNNWTGNGFSAWRDQNSASYNVLIRSNAESSHSGFSFFPDINQWTMISYVYTGSELIGYKNGNEFNRITYGNKGNVIHPVMYLGNSTYSNAPNSEIDECCLSDFRFYTTALTSDNILNLYQSAGSFTDSGIVIAHEFVEQLNISNIQFNKNGILKSGDISEIGYVGGMKTKVLLDGSVWARIHWLDVTTNKTWFTNTAEVLDCDAINRFSKMGLVDHFIQKDGTYEFMLTYPSLSSTLYNRWTQTSSPNTNIVTGLNKITTAWNAHNSGIRKHGSACLYNCDSGNTWYAPIGQYQTWTSTQYIPGADGSSQTETELWVRIDNLSNLTKISMLDNKYIQAFNIYEI